MLINPEWEYDMIKGSRKKKILNRRKKKMLIPGDWIFLSWKQIYPKQKEHKNREIKNLWNDFMKFVQNMKINVLQ